MVNPLDNGNPLTFNWLNQLANTVISHDKSLSKMTGNQKISIVPSHVSTGIGSGTVQVLTGKTSVSFAPNSANESVNVSFNTSFSNSSVIVLAQINYPNNGPSGFAAFCNVTNVKGTGCTINVHRLAPLTKSSSTKAEIVYLAIGPGKAS